MSRVDHDLVLDLAKRMVQWDTQNLPGNKFPLAEYLAGRLRESGLEVKIMSITKQHKEPPNRHFVTCVPVPC